MLAHLYFFIIFNFIYKFFHTFQYNFILVLTFDGSDSGFSLAAFFLASSIIEPQSSANLIASFFPLKMLLKLENAFFFVFLIYFKFLFFQISTKFFCLCLVSSSDISPFLMLSRKATESFNSLKPFSRPLLLTINFKSS